MRNDIPVIMFNYAICKANGRFSSKTLIKSIKWLSCQINIIAWEILVILLYASSSSKSKTAVSIYIFYIFKCIYSEKLKIISATFARILCSNVNKLLFPIILASEIALKTCSIHTYYCFSQPSHCNILPDVNSWNVDWREKVHQKLQSQEASCKDGERQIAKRFGSVKNEGHVR